MTNIESDPKKLARHYPRGEAFLKKAFRMYSPNNVRAWFEHQGVELKTEPDGRVFPASDNSETIVNALVQFCISTQVKIQTGEAGIRVSKAGGGLVVETPGNNYSARFVVCCIGGHQKPEAYSIVPVENLIHPIPSLFSFNIPQSPIKDLMGISVPNARVQIIGSEFNRTGPLLITHWGLSGPAIIQLSAHAAVELNNKGYRFEILVNWDARNTENELRGIFQGQRQTAAKSKVIKNSMFELPTRLWSRLCLMAEIAEERVWGEMSNKEINKLIEVLFRMRLQVVGKTTFKDEFVTCGGVGFSEFIEGRLESKSVSGLFFAGEVLNIDGETGGFNFQAAWTTAYLVAKEITTRIQQD